ncbi:Tetratricopeptide repeat-containing protein [Micromonospora pattaloongensis]|uniref:Tetratricopeptide repeat-containing protein n=1 Tax=Micromonospora pattaloongensis TaxID=405436 RepID=A0A1H3LV02_9ACTN|nr:tetratricopeptide repeat protein [Micromonospora pattaloongensis]SDY68242.1 Tetratricopeptide repeat-containing protein [Micromonospora pattaloongensis]
MPPSPIPTAAPGDDPAQIANLVITWSGVILAAFALLVAILTVLFVVAGFVGIRELRSIRQTGERARRELDKQQTVAQEIVAQADRAIHGAEILSEQANTLIGRVQTAVARADEQSEQVHLLIDDMQSRLSDFDQRLTTQVEVSYLFNQGEAAYREGNYATSVEYLRRAIELDPKNPRVRYRLGRSLTNLGEDAAAAEELKTALEYHLPTHAGERALALLHRYSDPDLALAHARRAIQHNPAEAGTWNCLGLILRDNGDFAGAREAHQQANQLDGEQVVTPFYLALLAAQAQALPHARDRSAEAIKRLETGHGRASIKPMWAALIRWADLLMRGSYAEADRFADILYETCPSTRRAREICDHMDFLLRSLGREEHRERYVARIEEHWLSNHQG